MPHSRAEGWRYGQRRWKGWYFTPVNGVYRADQVLDGDFPRGRFIPCLQQVRDRQTGYRWPPRLFLVKRENPVRPLFNAMGEPTARGRMAMSNEVPWTDFAKQLDAQRLLVGLDKYFNARIFYDPARPHPPRLGAIDADIAQALGTGEDEEDEDL